MKALTSPNTTSVEFSGPVQVADRIWWVGRHLPGDPFQCHVYLIEHGEQSVLIDPGSVVTFPDTLRKIEQIVPFEAIRYFVCQHADPDITAALPAIDSLVRRADATLVTHWRSAALIKHYGLRLPYWLVEDHDWALELGGRALRFTFTPYMHFPGAFTTFDEPTGTLFSSDIFGGFTGDDWTLWARDESYFEEVRPFLEHYVPSREVLGHGIAELEKLPIRIIAPQHGSLIGSSLVAPILDWAKELDCGLYLLVDKDSDIRRLSQRTALTREVVQSLASGRDFHEIISSLLDVTRRLLPVAGLEFHALDWHGTLLALDSVGTRGADLSGVDAGTSVGALLGLDRRSWPRTHGGAHLVGEGGAPPGEPTTRLIVPLSAPRRGAVRAAAVLHLQRPFTVDADTARALQEISVSLEVAVERELLVRTLQDQREQNLERSLHDPLTGLYNRSALDDAAIRLLAAHDRRQLPDLCLILLDIDHFKAVNDTHGHAAGDTVLRRIASVLTDSLRSGDLAVRFGGEEFVLLLRAPLAAAVSVANRIREQIERVRYNDPQIGPVTISAGVAALRCGEDIGALLARADVLLYAAKAAGRNCTRA